MKKFMKVVATALCAGMVLSSGLFASSPVVYAADGVAINEKNFPDDNFRNYVLENCDSNGDGVLSSDEKSKVYEIQFGSKNIESLVGIEHFYNLEELNCSGNQLTSLDVSNNTNLLELWCFENQLTSLDVSKNTKLEQLYCFGNQLTSLDVSNNTNLLELYCSDNQITNLDVSKNTNLEVLDCDNNQLTSLDVSNNAELYGLNCSGNQLTSLDVSNNAELHTFWCSDNQLTSLDVSNNAELYDLDCGGNQLTTLDVSNNTELKYFDCSDNQMTSIDVSQNTKLYRLNCNGNQLTSLDVSKNPELYGLYCSGNQLTSLDVSNNAALDSLDCSSIKLTNLDVSNNTGLHSLDCSSNLLTSIDLSKNIKLMDLYCRDNKLTNLDISNIKGYLSLDCSFNQLTSLDLSNNVALVGLDCSGNQLTNLDLSRNIHLYDLNCSDNILTSLILPIYDMSSLGLNEVYCNNNKLTSLDISGHRRLEILVCNGNEINTIDISNNLYLNDLCQIATPIIEITDGMNVATWDYTKREVQGYDMLVETTYTIKIDEQTSLSSNNVVFYTPGSLPVPTPTVGPIPTAIPTAAPAQSAGNFVDRCYSVALNRKADEEGFDYWLDSLNNGKICGAQAGYGFIFSGEYANKETTNEEFVTDLYSMYFGRTPDEGGFNYWVGLLNSGATREEIFAGFANSSEFDNLCSDYGVVTGAYLVGVPVAQQGGVNSFVARLYNICLNRRPDQVGQAGWAQKLISGELTGTSCAHGFVFSPEFIDNEPSNEEFVACMYRAFFGREPDIDGFTVWVQKLNEGATYEEVFNGFSGSAEFTNLCAGYGINP